jgi:hypothetical protein
MLCDGFHPRKPDRVRQLQSIKLPSAGRIFLRPTLHEFMPTWTPPETSAFLTFFDGAMVV